ncbi:MAG: hypothetical protein OK457_07380 [Thaumarchaeota archaeon]|nr:hypothetical protein [Nitrososphaerota archaeon]
MALAQAIAVVDKNRLWVVSGKEVVPLSDVAARIVFLLTKSKEAMSGGQISSLLEVTPSAVTKASAKLVDLGILKRDSLAVAKNIKVYSLAVNIMDERSFESVRKRVPGTLLKRITERLGGHEKLALAFVYQLLDLTDKLSETDRLAIMELFGQKLKVSA